MLVDLLTCIAVTNLSESSAAQILFTLVITFPRLCIDEQGSGQKDICNNDPYEQEQGLHRVPAIMYQQCADDHD